MRGEQEEARGWGSRESHPKRWAWTPAHRGVRPSAPRAPGPRRPRPLRVCPLRVRGARGGGSGSGSRRRAGPRGAEALRASPAKERSVHLRANPRPRPAGSAGSTGGGAARPPGQPPAPARLLLPSPARALRGFRGRGEEGRTVSLAVDVPPGKDSKLCARPGPGRRWPPPASRVSEGLGRPGAWAPPLSLRGPLAPGRRSCAAPRLRTSRAGLSAGLPRPAASAAGVRLGALLPSHPGPLPSEAGWKTPRSLSLDSGIFCVFRGGGGGVGTRQGLIMGLPWLYPSSR